MSEIHFGMFGLHVKVSQRHLGTCFPVICLRDMSRCLGDMLRCLGDMLRCLGNMLTFLQGLEYYKLSEFSPNLTRQQTRSCFQLTFSYCLPTCIACRDNALGMPTDPSALLMKASCFSQAKVCWSTSKYLLSVHIPPMWEFAVSCAKTPSAAQTSRYIRLPHRGPDSRVGQNP